MQPTSPGNAGQHIEGTSTALDTRVWKPTKYGRARVHESDRKAGVMP